MPLGLTMSGDNLGLYIFITQNSPFSFLQLASILLLLTT